MTCFFYKAISIGRLSTTIIGVYPIKHIGGLSTIFSEHMSNEKNIEGWSNYIIGVCPIKLKQKSFVLETVFIHSKRMCEGVGEDSRHAARHVIIHA